MVGRVQANCTSIQAVLEKAVSTFLGVPTHINGSGRTDAGVHALGQVANFFTDKEYLPYRILRGLNALTPRDITVKEVEDRRLIPSTRGATAEAACTSIGFSIAQRRRRSNHNRAWHIHEPLEVERYAKAIRMLDRRA